MPSRFPWERATHPWCPQSLTCPRPLSPSFPLSALPSSFPLVQLLPITISGATLKVLDGTYEPASETHNKRGLYYRKTDVEEQWIFMGADGKWHVGDTKAKTSDSGGYLQSVDTDAIDPTFCETWEPGLT